MKKRLLPAFFFIAFMMSSTGSHAQSIPKSYHLYINLALDTLTTDRKAAAKLWESYLFERVDSTKPNPYWSLEEQRIFKPFDLAGQFYTPSSIRRFAKSYPPTLLSMTPEDSVFILRTLFSTIEDSIYASPLFIIKIIVKRENGKLKLFNFLPYATKDWQRNTVGNFSFYCPPEHHFSRPLADRLNRYIDSLTALMHFVPRHIEYYFTDKFVDLFRVNGIDYDMTEGATPIIAGKSTEVNNMVFCGGIGEFYPHEVLHQYLNPAFPNAHSYFHEGAAAYWGGSMGLSLHSMLVEVKRFLEQNPDYDFTKLLSGWNGLITGKIYGHYAIGGLLVKLADKKGGMPEVLKLFHYGSTVEEFFRAVHDVLVVEKKDFNTYIKQKIREEVTR